MYAARDKPTYKDTYWADEPNPKDLVDYCRDKIRVYHDYLEESHFINRINRNWRYYHGLFFGGTEAQVSAIKVLGQQGELAGIAVNELRSQGQQMLAIATQDRPRFVAEAVNTSTRALQEARRARLTVNYYYEKKGGESRGVRALEQALILSEGYMYTTWDHQAHQYQSYKDPMTGQVPIPGDIRYDNPSLFDVARDYRVRAWEDLQWVLVRTLHNRWDLIARYAAPEDFMLEEEGLDEEAQEARMNLRQALLQHREEEHEEFLGGRFPYTEDVDSDLISVWTFHHLATDAIPEGRIFRFFGDTPLPGEENDGPDPYGCLPIDRVVAAETLLTSFGYSPLFDLQPINEAINGEASTILSNHRTFGRQVVWVPQGSAILPVQLEGFTLIEADQEPKGIQLTSPHGDFFAFKQQLRQDGEYTTGINSTARGQPTAKEASGTALALVDAKAAQILNPLLKNYQAMLSGVATKTYKILNHFLPEERMLSLVGDHNRAYEVTVKKGGFDYVDRVVIRSGSAFLATTSGRVQMLDIISKFTGPNGAPLLRTPEEIINLIEAGTIEPLLEAENAQVNAVREENENLMRPEGRAHASIIDNHLLHIREHAALLNTTETREDDQFVARVEGHIMEHVQQLVMGGPVGQYLQVALGFAPPPPPPIAAIAGGMAPGMAGPGGPPGAKPVGPGTGGQTPGAPPKKPPEGPRPPGPGGPQSSQPNMPKPATAVLPSSRMGQVA